jgi:hypothetical protein
MAVAVVGRGGRRVAREEGAGRGEMEGRVELRGSAARCNEPRVDDDGDAVTTR